MKSLELLQELNYYIRCTQPNMSGQHHYSLMQGADTVIRRIKLYLAEQETDAQSTPNDNAVATEHGG